MRLFLTFLVPLGIFIAVLLTPIYLQRDLEKIEDERTTDLFTTPKTTTMKTKSTTPTTTVITTTVITNTTTETATTILTTTTITMRPTTLTTGKTMTTTRADTAIMVFRYEMSQAYLLAGDGSTKTPVSISAPSDDYTKYSAFAVIKDNWYIFGGRSDRKKVAKLEGCEEIWILQNDQWSVAGNLQKPISHSNSILVGNSVYVISGGFGEDEFPLQRLDLREDEIINTEILGYHDNYQYWPVIFQADSFDFCVSQ